MNGAQNDTERAVYEETGQQQIPPPAGGQGYGGPPPHVRPLTGGKSTMLATLLSLGPGLGQIYVGYYNQGFVNIAVVAGTITLLSAGLMRSFEPFLGVFLAFFWIYNMIDANRRAHHYNRTLAGLGGEQLPEDFKIPSGGGSLIGGAVLVLLGILFILDLNFDVSMEWVENWWPLVLVGIGLRLIYLARSKKD